MSAIGITLRLAAVALRRLVRGRTLWVGAIVAAFPIAFAALLAAREQSAIRTFRDVLVFETLVLAVLPALFVAGSLGEEIEDRTTTYLWSRPIPRWTFVAGKILALAPIVALLVTASWIAALYIGTELWPSLDSLVGLAAGAGALCCVAATIATLVPRHAMAVTICYMLLIDLPIGALPATMREISVTHQVRVLADMIGASEESPGFAALGIAVIAASWLAVGLLRIRRLEA